VQEAASAAEFLSVLALALALPMLAVLQSHSSLSFGCSYFAFHLLAMLMDAV